MSKRYQGGILGVGFNPLQAPNAPTIGTATVLSGTSVSVAFTAPANVGGSAITSYVVQSTPGGINATGASSPITVSGLTVDTAYTFRVTALNSYGPSPASAASNSVTPAVTGQTAYTTAGTYSYVVPAGVTSVSVVAVGGGGGGGGTNDTNSRGGGGGGALAYVNNISVTPGETLTVTVGAGGLGGANGASGTSGDESALQRSATYLVRAGRGSGGTQGAAARGGAVYVGTGGEGGTGAVAATSNGTGGGGAGGYAGAGGAGNSDNSNGSAAAASSGGGGGGASGNFGSIGGGGGGGVGILGIGATGTGGIATGGGGVGGSGGANGTTATTDAGAAGGAYGGGGGGANDDGAAGAAGGGGAVRIIWPGTTRSFPSTNTGDL